MTAKQIVEEIRRCDGEIALKNEQVKFKAPPTWSHIERDLALSQLRANKQDIIAYLVSEERFVAPPSALAACGKVGCAGENCYKVGPNVWIHSPRSEYHNDHP
jgi:hypothetical protein